MKLDIAPVAYFSMEIGLEPDIPTYAGGLGMLAGDTLRAAAHLGIPLIGITLLYRQGYFHQQLDPHGRQSESPMPWAPEEFLQPLSCRAKCSRLVSPGEPRCTSDLTCSSPIATGCCASTAMWRRCRSSSRGRPTRATLDARAATANGTEFRAGNHWS